MRKYFFTHADLSGYIEHENVSDKILRTNLSDGTPAIKDKIYDELRARTVIRKEEIVAKLKAEVNNAVVVYEFSQEDSSGEDLTVIS